MALVWLYGKWEWLWDPSVFWPLYPVESPDTFQKVEHVSAESRQDACHGK